jgi:hypothetical protein
VTLFDVAGCVVAQEFVALDRSGSIELSLDGLVAGTYVIRLAGAEHSAFTRLVVTR